MADYRSMETFHDNNADRFAAKCETGKPEAPLSPFYTFMFAWQFSGVACNGGWAHALRCYSDEFALIKDMLANIGASKLLSDIHDCQSLLDGLEYESTGDNTRGVAHEEIDDRIRLSYDHLDLLIEKYFDDHHAHFELTR